MMRMSMRMIHFSASRRAARTGATADNVADTLLRLHADMAVAVGVKGTFGGHLMVFMAPFYSQSESMACVLFLSLHTQKLH